MATRLIPVLMAVWLLAGCEMGPPPEIQWKAFDGQKAYDHVRALVALGPHPSGSPAHQQAGNYIAAELKRAGLDVEEQLFRPATPRGSFQFRNIIGKTKLHSGVGKIIVIGSHYDTKYLPKIKFVGANDGGSSTGALLEMARVASKERDLWFVFFDGEEAIVDYAPNDGLQGSRYFVEDLRKKGQIDTIRAMVLLDMVGDANLNITIPSGCTSSLVERLFQAAKDTGCRDYFSYRTTDILDDHVPFLREGIPAVDLIDFEYGNRPGFNNYWHREFDTLDKISPRSLEIVGQTALRLLTLIQQNPPLR